MGSVLGHRLQSPPFPSSYCNTWLPPVSATSSPSPAAGSSGPGPLDLNPGSVWGLGSGSPARDKFNYITLMFLMTKTCTSITGYRTKRAVSTERHGSVCFGTGRIFGVSAVKREPKGPNNRTVPCLFWSPFPSSPKGFQGGGATHTAVCWLQAGKKLFLSVAVEPLICHFSKFSVFFRRESYNVDFKYVISLTLVCKSITEFFALASCDLCGD